MLTIHSRFFFLIAFVLCIMAQGCTNDEDDIFPEIKVLEPLAGSSFENGDTIRFQAVFSDNQQLSFTEVALVDMDNKPMLATVHLAPGQNPFTFSGDYYINDPLLPGGDYYLRFRASDGKNVENIFVKIRVYELNRELLYPVIVTHPELDTWSVYRMNSINVWQNIYTHTGDYSGSVVNSAASQLYTCGIYQTDLTAVRLPDGIPQWKVKPMTHQSGKWFGGISFTNPILYISTADGSIRGYDKTGNEIYHSAIFGNGVPGLSVTTNNFVISSFRNAFSNDRYLVAFHITGGLMIHTKFMQAEVAAMAYAGSDKVLVFSNNGGHGEILLYNGTDNTLGLLHSSYEGTFHTASKIDTDNYLVSTNTGIFRYRKSNNSFTLFVTKNENSIMAYENISQLVYVCSGKTMEIYTFPLAGLEQTFTLPDTAVDIHLVYNK